MERLVFMIALIALFVAMIVVALAASDRNTNVSALLDKAAYIPTEHCNLNPKIEGCNDEKSAQLNTQHYNRTILAICCPIAASMFMGAVWLISTEADQKERRKRLFELCLCIGTGLLTIILFVLKDGGPDAL